MFQFFVRGYVQIGLLASQSVGGSQRSPFSYGFLKYGKKAGTRKARGQKIAGLVTTIFLLVIRKVKPMHRRCGCRLPQRLSFQINGLSVKSLLT